MAWQAFISEKSFTTGFITLRVRYTDGKQEYVEKLQINAPDSGWPGNAIKTRLAQLEQLTVLDQGLVVDDVNPFVVPPDPVPPTPDPVAEAKAALSMALVVYENAVRVNSAGGTINLAPLKQAVVDAQAALDAL